jgi:3-oxoacyl-[acyl-carrier-protein] synthase-3
VPTLHSDPADLERFWCEFPPAATRPRAWISSISKPATTSIRLDAERVHPQAERALAGRVRESLERAGSRRRRIALHVVNYFDPRVARRALAAEGVPETRILATAETRATSVRRAIPLAMRRRARERARRARRPRLLLGLRGRHVVGCRDPGAVREAADERDDQRAHSRGRPLRAANVVTNADLTRVMDTSDEWIQQRTGIRQRHFVAEDAGPADLAVHAAREALDEAAIAPADLDLILLGTLSPDVDFPASASLLQRHLGVPGMPAMDVRNQCSGFSTCSRRRTRSSAPARRDTCWWWVPRRTRPGSTCRPRVARSPSSSATAPARSCSDPSRIRAAASCRRIFTARDSTPRSSWSEPTVEPPEPARLAGHADRRRQPPLAAHGGRYVFKHAVTRFTEVITEALEANGLTAADIDLLIPHQANLRISQLVAMGFELPEEKVFNNIQRYGNTTAASIPIALYEARKEGRIRRARWSASRPSERDSRGARPRAVVRPTPLMAP